MTHARTIPNAFRRQAERLGPRPAVRFKRLGVWIDVGWSEWHERVRAAALGLVELGVRPGDRVAILSENRFEWLIADLAILTAGAATVPVHASLGSEQIRLLLADSGAAAIVTSCERQAAKLRPIADRLPGLRTTIVMEDAECTPVGRVSDPAEGEAAIAKSDDVRPRPGRRPGLRADCSWAALEQLGRLACSSTCDELTVRNERLSGDDLASLIYTSGTTGVPKGVMLTHRNFLSNGEAMIDGLGGFALGAIAFNWLPLSHVYGRTVDLYVSMLAGALIVLGESPETVVPDLLATRPMHLSSVPRMYEKLLANIAGLPVEQRRAKLRAIFGPRIQWLGCGGAALPPAVAEAYRDAGLEVVVGYGLTESSPVISTNALGANKLGTVGRVLPGVEVKIAPDGEILTRGPHVMAGYWKQPDATAAVLEDGWLHTGDLGQLDADGYLSITGRKKDLIVLSSGKNVAPVPLEGLLMASPLVEQVVIFGEGRPFLTAVVVPRDPATDREALMRDVESLLANVAPWEHVRKIVVTTRPFSIASNEVTVSMKLRRPAIYDHYRAEIEALY